MPSRYSEHNKNIVLDPVPNTTDTIRVYGKKRANKLRGTEVTGTTISFTHNAAAADTINDSGNGLAGFSAGDAVAIAGGSNDGFVGQITGVAAGVLTLHTRDIVTTETASASIKVFQTNHLEEEYQNLLVALAALRLAQDYGYPKDRVTELRTRYNEELAVLQTAQDLGPILVVTDSMGF